MILGITVVLFLTAPNTGVKGEIKQEVVKEIGRQDFNVEAILVESGDWQLAKLVSTASDDVGNPALVILKKENGKMSLKFGPGTRFPRAELDSAGVPMPILDKLFDSPYVKDPIVNYLPYTTKFYSVELSSTDENTQEKKFLLVTVYEVPRYGIYATDEKKAEYKIEITEWIRSLGLDPNNYTLIFTT